MIVARDSVFQECIQFLEHCEGMYYTLLMRVNMVHFLIEHIGLFCKC